MFEFIRTHSRLMLGLIVLLIIPSFVFFGIQGYSRMTDGGNAAVAEVDGHAITRAEWDFAHQRAVEGMRRRMPTVDANLLDTPAFRRQTLDSMVRERVLLAEASDRHLFPTEERLERLFKSDPQFADLRNPDGSVRKELLAAQGMTSQAFAQQLITQYGMQQVLDGVSRTVVAPAAVADTSLDALLQRREIQVQRFDAAAYRGQVQPTDAELEAYHQAHAAEFRAPEQARIEYVVLDLDSIAKDVTVPEDDLRRYYDENIARYTKAEERRARHILIEADASAPAAEREKAKARAEALLAQVRAKPDSFAEVAKKNSQDAGSAPEGGDLGFFDRNAMVKPFADAAFAMKKGEISNVVETEYGYHIIQLVDVRGGEKQPFDAVRADIEKEVRRSLAQKQFAADAEQFSNMVYEQPDSLKPAVDRFKLPLQTATVQRQPAPGAEGPLASAKLLEAVFGEDALRNKRNTDAVETGPNQLVSARVQEHQPERTLPLADVKDQVRDAVVAERAAALAHQAGEQRLAELKGKPEATLPQALTISRAKTEGLPRALLQAALGADPGALPATLGVDLGAEGYAVLRVLRTLPRDPAAAGGSEPLRKQYAQAWSQAESQALYEALKQRHGVEVKAIPAGEDTP